jgi:sorbitol-specific phosphotransferase system component IIC
MSRRQRRTRRGGVLDLLLFVLLPVVLLLVFFEPITQWVGQYMADAIMPSITHASPSSSP